MDDRGPQGRGLVTHEDLGLRVLGELGQQVNEDADGRHAGAARGKAGETFDHGAGVARQGADADTRPDEQIAQDGGQETDAVAAPQDA